MQKTRERVSPALVTESLGACMRGHQENRMAATSGGPSPLQSRQAPCLSEIWSKFWRHLRAENRFCPGILFLRRCVDFRLLAKSKATAPLYCGKLIDIPVRNIAFRLMCFGLEFREIHGAERFIFENVKTVEKTLIPSVSARHFGSKIQAS